MREKPWFLEFSDDIIIAKLGVYFMPEPMDAKPAMWVKDDGRSYKKDDVIDSDKWRQTQEA